MKIAICDDSRKDSEVLSFLVGTYFRLKHLPYKIDYFTSGEDLYCAIKESTNYELVFLDIYMGGMTGMDIAKKLFKDGFDGDIIFTTTSPDFAVESYEVEASSYLLKPILKEKLMLSLDNIVKRLGENQQYLIVKIKNGVKRVPYSRIIYVESRGNLILLHDCDGNTLKFYGKLTEIQKKINDARFLRCHQSYLINMTFVNSAGEDFKLSNQVVVPIKVRERKAIRNSYFEFILSYESGEAEG